MAKMFYTIEEVCSKLEKNEDEVRARPIGYRLGAQHEADPHRDNRDNRDGNDHSQSDLATSGALNRKTHPHLASSPAIRVAN